jgi:hypothetical protein
MVFMFYDRPLKVYWWTIDSRKWIISSTVDQQEIAVDALCIHRMKFMSDDYQPFLCISKVVAWPGEIGQVREFWWNVTQQVLRRWLNVWLDGRLYFVHSALFILHRPSAFSRCTAVKVNVFKTAFVPLNSLASMHSLHDFAEATHRNENNWVKITEFL